MKEATTSSERRKPSASTKRYYEGLHPSLKAELPQWDQLSNGCTNKLKAFLMELKSMNRVERNLFLECTKHCEGEIKARSTNGVLYKDAVAEAIRQVTSNKQRQQFKSLLATLFSYRGNCAKGKSEGEKQAERDHREILRSQPALATA